MHAEMALHSHTYAQTNTKPENIILQPYLLAGHTHKTAFSSFDVVWAKTLKMAKIKINAKL